MTLPEAREKLARYGQEQLLRFYDDLDEPERQALCAQIERTDFDVLKNMETRGKKAARGTFTPLMALELSDIEQEADRFREEGLAIIRARKAAAVLLAGGMGTRLGSDDPKGMYDIGITKPVYIFQRLIENLKEVTDEAGNTIRLFIMTSEKNHDATVRFLKEKAFFGYPEEDVTFFMQDMAPACDYDGKVFLEDKGTIATSPNGNAGWYKSMQKARLDRVLHDEHIEWLNVFAVDNVLQRIADPVFLGATALAKAECGSKVVRKANPDEAVGVMCLEDGRPSIVEYYELTGEMRDAVNDKGDPAYNFGVILNYLFYEPALRRIAEKQLPLHVVEKKIAHVDENGNPVKADKPNGCKFEQLVLDMIHELDSCVAFEVVREHEFAPVKNKTGVDSVESARALCEKAGIIL
ncbi:MAG: UTP--glucose-1-phosphate uridylyltransferase [Lachnospiraceae bacterium]|nr:UTP--glucose-1-phosphate uridylyltransferase [Lachnospiraceae bacterium]